MDFAAMKPADLRGLIRKGELTGPTTGMCNGYAQGNLVVLPKALAWDFLLQTGAGGNLNLREIELLRLAGLGHHGVVVG